jgi:lysophospholipase L1-like esterase
MRKILVLPFLFLSISAQAQISIGNGISGNTVSPVLINQNSLSARYPLAPNQIPGYQTTLDRWHLWKTGFTFDGSGLVQQWDDAGPNARNITQGTASNRPQVNYALDVVCNGNKALVASSYTLNQPITYYARYRQIAPWTATRYLIDGNTLNSGAVFQNTASPQLVLYAGTNPGARISPSITAWTATSWVLNGASSSSRIYGQADVTGNSGVNNPGGFTLCGAGGGIGFIVADVREVATFNVAHSGATRARLLAYFNMVGPAPAKVLLADGDSQTFGFSMAETSSYPGQLRNLVNPDWEVVNYGITSQQCTAMTTNAPTKIDTWNVVDHAIVIVAQWCGTNDLYFGATAATTYSNIAAYATGRRAAGAKVIIVTLLSRSDAGTPGTYNADRATVNANIVANAATISDCVYRADLDSDIGGDGAELNLTFFQADKVHLNPTGEAKIAAGVNACRAALSAP